MTNYIFVTGGVISGLGKGVTSASIGVILQMLNQKNITIKKLDPYLNIDAGTMNPIEHGEVFVTEDGIETDLDLGYYERFLEIKMNENNSTSSGKLFQKLLNNERKGKYLGKTVQMIPHFTNIIKEFIKKNSDKYNYIICEIGGSVGDIEAMAFFEAIRQLKQDIHNDNILYIHLTYLLSLQLTKELKTKPTQNTIKDLQQVGITPDILICRSDTNIPAHIKEKLSLHTNLPLENIISAVNVSSIYQVPIDLINEGIHNILSKKFNIQNRLQEEKWITLNNKITSINNEITIGIIGKYTELNDSYKSLLEAIFHAGIYNNHKINIQWINARENENISFEEIQGIIIPGGFGITGIENILPVIELSRKNKIPTFGICLGMQLMIIEFFRNVLGYKDAGSEEFNSSKNIITKINNTTEVYGGSMRLGKHKIELLNQRIKDTYQSTIIYERHRHRYTVDQKYLELFNMNGLNIVGKCPENNLIEIIELNKEKFNHPWFIGTQYHPEYQSSPFNPHPLFISFIKKCISK